MVEWGSEPRSRLFRVSNFQANINITRVAHSTGAIAVADVAIPRAVANFSADPIHRGEPSYTICAVALALAGYAVL